MPPTIALAAAPSYTFSAPLVWLVAGIALVTLLALLLAGVWTLLRPNRLARHWLALLYALAGLFFLAALVAAGTVLFDTVRGVLSPPATGPSSPNLGAGALIAAILGAPFIIWGTVLKYQTVRFQKEGHITERISQAVEHLGAEKTVERRGRTLFYTLGEEKLSAFEYDDQPYLYPAGATEIKQREWGQIKRTEPNIEVRLGGLLSLERIAQDSVAYDRGRDHVRIMEILCAYIRHNAPASEAETPPGDDPEGLPKGATAEAAAAHAQAWEARREELQDWAWDLPPPRADIQMALDILGRRGTAHCAYEAGWHHGAVAQATWPFAKPAPPWPKGGDAKAQAQWQSDLEAWQESLKSYSGYRLDLCETNLQGADLGKALLAGARLEDAQMQGANLGGAQMQGADLRGAQMQGADLGAAQMQGAGLGQARIQGASLWQAQMLGANLDAARMQGANLWQAQMLGAGLRGAQMQGAYLREAQMQGADLWQAQMQGAILPGSNLTATRLLTQEQIDSARGDNTTLLPEHLSHPAHWLEGRFAFQPRPAPAKTSDADQTQV